MISHIYRIKNVTEALLQYCAISLLKFPVFLSIYTYCKYSPGVFVPKQSQAIY